MAAEDLGVLSMKKLMILCGALLLANGALITLISNLNFGTLLVFGLGAVLLLFGLFWKHLWKWLRVVVLCGCALLVLLTGALSLYGSFDNATGTEDALIVLGCGVRGDRVSVGLARRLDKAAAFYKEHPDVLIVVTGGQGAQETIPEADAMARYLLAGGVPKEKIIKEPTASSTLENLRFSDALLQKKLKRDDYTAAIVTSRFHVFRAEHVAYALGFSFTHLGAGSIWYTVPMNNLRELCAIANELLRGTLKLQPAQ